MFEGGLKTTDICLFWANLHEGTFQGKHTKEHTKAKYLEMPSQHKSQRSPIFSTDHVPGVCDYGCMYCISG